MEAGRWWLAGTVVATSLIAVVYVWRFVEAAYLSPPPADAQTRIEAPWGLLVPSWVLVVACFWFGLDTSFSAEGARRAAQFLLGGGP